MRFIIRDGDLNLPKQLVTRIEKIKIPDDSEQFKDWCRRGTNVQIFEEFATREILFEEPILEIDTLKELLELAKDHHIEIYTAPLLDVDGFIYLSPERRDDWG